MLTSFIVIFKSPTNSMKFLLPSVIVLLTAATCANAVCCFWASSPGECGFVKRSMQEGDLSLLRKREPLDSLISCCCQAADAQSCATACVSIDTTLWTQQIITHSYTVNRTQFWARLIRRFRMTIVELQLGRTVSSIMSWEYEVSCLSTRRRPCRNLSVKSAYPCNWSYRIKSSAEGEGSSLTSPFLSCTSDPFMTNTPTNTSSGQNFVNQHRQYNAQMLQWYTILTHCF